MRREAWLTLAALTWAPAPWAATAEPGAKAYDACSLLSVGEVTAVVGRAANPGARHDSGQTKDGSFSSTCVWTLQGPPVADLDGPFQGGAFAMLNTAIWPKGSGLSRKYLQDFRDAAEKHDIDREPVPVEAGDEALWWGDGVAVAAGDVSFGVSIRAGADKAAEKAMEEALARTVAARLTDGH